MQVQRLFRPVIHFQPCKLYADSDEITSDEIEVGAELWKILFVDDCVDDLKPMRYGWKEKILSFLGLNLFR